MDQALFEHYLAQFTERHGPDGIALLRSTAIKNQLLQRFAMGFIKANGGKSKRSEEERISTALQSLFGTIPLDPRSEDDEDLLEEMAAIELADKSLGQKERSIAQVAQLIAGRAKGNSEQAIIKRLSRKYQSRKSEFLALAADEEADIELLLRSALADIERILERFDIKFWSEL